MIIKKFHLGDHIPDGADKLYTNVNREKNVLEFYFLVPEIDPPTKDAK